MPQAPGADLRTLGSSADAQGQKRPVDVIGGAVKVMRIATGEAPEDSISTPARAKAVAIVQAKAGS